MEALDMPERAGAGIVPHLEQGVIVVLQRLLAHHDVPTAGPRPQNERPGPSRTQGESHRVRVTDCYGFYRGEQRRPRAGETLGRDQDALEGGLHVCRSQIAPVVKGHALPEEKRVGFLVFADLPTLPTVCRAQYCSM
jgi:hypothetical protein